MPGTKISKLYLAFGLVTPVAVMFGSQLFGQAPASADADSILDQQVIGPETLVRIEIPELRNAAPFDATTIDSPFYFEGQRGLIQRIPTPLPVERQDPGSESAEIPVIEVSSILPHPTRPLAVINGKPARLGERLGGGWDLESVAADGRSVVIVHTSGRRIRVPLKNSP